ncbi:MAG: hypothetical protein IPN29_16045 [Saprospiraceae bacterium]|nr:hypothetical protein [Saprospiraceae bacterium]
MDRMDYLSRDSYYTGVAEGVIGYDRIIKMLNVCDQQLVVEEKGLHSIEKFLISRYLMYAQVYLHKTSLVAEKMLKSAVERAIALIKTGDGVDMTPQLFGVLSTDLQYDPARILTSFSALDDMDVWDMLKRNLDHPDKSMLCRGLIYRNLFEIRMSHEPVAEEVMEQLLGETANLVSISHEDAAFLVFQGKESVSGYKEDQSAIRMMTKGGMVIPLSEYTGLADALTIEKRGIIPSGQK